MGGSGSSEEKRGKGAARRDQDLNYRPPYHERGGRMRLDSGDRQPRSGGQP